MYSSGFIEKEAGGTVEQFQLECKEALRTLDEFSTRRLVYIVPLVGSSGVTTTTTTATTTVAAAITNDSLHAA